MCDEESRDEASPSSEVPLRRLLLDLYLAGLSMVKSLILKFVVLRMLGIPMVYSPPRAESRLSSDVCQ